MANKKNKIKTSKSLSKTRKPQPVELNVEASDSTETLNNSNNNEENQQLKCLVCARKFNSSEASAPFDEVFTFQILCKLFKILKISPAVCRFLLADSLSTVKVEFCESCDKTISHCLKVSQEIDNLRNVLEESTIKIKEDIIEGYYCRPDPDLSQRTNSNIRKTLVQCWTTCQVKVKRLPPSSFESHPRVKFTKRSKLVLPSVKQEICDDNEVDFTEGPSSPSPNEIIVKPQTQKNVVETEGITSNNDFDDEDIEPPCSPIPATLSDESDTENIDDTRKEDVLSEAPCSPLPPSVSEGSDTEKVDPGKQNLISDAPRSPSASPLLGTDQSDAEKIGDPSTTETVLGVENEEECDLTSRRTLRPRRKNKILTVTPIEIESDDNASETGSVYSPDPPFNEEEQEIYEVNTKNKRHVRSLSSALKSRKSRAKVEPKAKPTLKRNRTGRSTANIQNTVATKSTSLNENSKDFSFFCKNCNKGFSEGQEFQDHKCQHSDVSRFPCDICNEVSFSLLHSLQNHKRVKHSATIIIPFKQKRHTLESFSCTYCDKHYERKDFRVNPDPATETGRDVLSIKCDLPNCDKNFSDFYCFSIHHMRTCLEKARLIAENPENYRKELGCVRIYSGSKTTNDITETETEDASTAANNPNKTTGLRCKICGMSFQRKRGLYLHEMRHAGQKVTCPECPEKFKSIVSVRLHQIRVHGQPTKSTSDANNELDSFECAWCKKSYMRSSFLVPGSEAEAEDPNGKDSGDPTSSNKILRIEVKQSGTTFWKTLSDFKEFEWHHRRECSWRPRIQVGSGYIENARIAVLQANTTTTQLIAYRCSICGKGYRILNRYNEHLAFHRQEFNYPCTICKDKFVSLDLLNRHVASTHEFASKEDKNAYKNSYHCTPCDKRIPCNLVVTESGEKKAFCVFDNCSKSSFNRTAHEAHHRKHHDDQKFSYFCQFCKKMFFAKDFRDVRISVGPEFKCSFAKCNKHFEHFRGWSHHHNYHHKKDRGLVPKQHHSKQFPTRVTCKFCQKEIANKFNLEMHIATAHTKKFKFYCEICGLGRPTLDKLRSHTATHSKERPFACELCPSTFKLKTQFKYHMNKHNGVLPFVCEICGKAYHASNTLNMHQKTHKR